MMKKRMTAGMLATLMAAVLPVSACAAQNSAPQPQLNTAEHMQYMNGYTDGTFRPDASITRAEASKLLASLLVNKVENEDHLFNDVSVSAWYADAVRQMTGFGLVNGYTDGTFKPNAKITRAEFVAILSRFPHTDIGTDKSYPRPTGRTMRCRPLWHRAGFRQARISARMHRLPVRRR